MAVSDDILDESSMQYAAKVQLSRYGQFLQELSDRLTNEAETYSFNGFTQNHVSALTIGLESKEDCSLDELVTTENELLNKVIRILGFLIIEVQNLRTEADRKFIPALLLYGEKLDIPKDDSADIVAQMAIARFLPLLQELSCFIERCCEVLRCLLHQLSGLHNRSPQKVIAVDGVHFDMVIEAIGHLMAVLITIDEIIRSHHLLVPHWKTYLRILKLVHHNPAKFDFQRNFLKQLESITEKLDAQLMSGYIVQNAAEQPFDSGEVAVARNQLLMDEMSLSIRQWCAKTIPSLGDASILTERRELVAVTGVYVLFLYIYRSVDKKALKGLFDLYKVLPAFQLVGDIFWCGPKYLLNKFPNLDSKITSAVTVNEQLQLQQIVQTLSRDCQACVMQVSDWLIRFSNIPDWSKHVNRDLEHRCEIFLQGIRFAFSISNLVKTTLTLYVHSNLPMTKATVNNIFQLVELLKGIETMYKKQWMVISESISHIAQMLSARCLKILASFHERVKTDKKYTDSRLDTLTAILLCEQVLCGPGTRVRCIVLRLALCIAPQSKLLKEDETSALLRLVDKLEAVCKLQERLADVCNCSFLYWHRSLLSAYFLELLENHPGESARLEYLFVALNDCYGLCNNAHHLERREAVADEFEKEVLACFQENFLDKLCQHVENDLRFSIHTHLQLNDRNPFTVGLKHYRHFLDLPPFRLRNKLLDVKVHVEQYLDKTFYNLTTVTLSDWKTYAEMKQLARQKYGLDLIEAHLPCQTLEQGLDVLEIMRNIHVFVAQYCYNLNNQIFLERSSNSKHLNTINIRHIANSIRTHGAGIMNTTVNFTYQFLRKKFYIFSQFLFDEQIKSRLHKDARYFRDNKETLNQLYPYEKAEKLHRGIRRLGLSAEGLSYLDQFRILITQIGNALGYVRMIRSGGLQCCAQAIQFVPDLDDIPQFQSLVDQANLSQETSAAAAVLDGVISFMVKSFAEGTEYFKLLVDVFSTEFRSQKNIHLKNFYVIVPPLTVNFVEHIVACKEKVAKKNTDATFTDDGFPMGVAYILQLLDQYSEFDSLHWFASVSQRSDSQKDELIKQQKNSIDDQKLKQTINLSLKRLEQFKKEFDLLNFSLTSARIFFRAERQQRIETGQAVDSDAASETSSEGRKSRVDPKN